MRVWIGCLACYNDGQLIGQWYDASEAGTVTPDMIHVKERVDPEVFTAYVTENHEELWCMDIEDAPSESLSREMSPSEAQAIADRLDDLERNHVEPAAYAAYCDNLGYDFTEDALGEFEDAYAGEWDNREDYAYNLAEDLGVLPEGNAWPGSYIDWKRAANDLFIGGDNWDAPAPGGRIYVFRSL